MRRLLYAIALLLSAVALYGKDFYPEAEEAYYQSRYADAILIALEGLGQEGVEEADAVELCSILGASYSRLGNFDKAAEYMMRCYRWDKAHGEKAGLTSSLINLASMYVYASKPELAVGYALEAIDNEQQVGRPDKLAMAYGKACDVYHALGQDTTALRYANLAVELSQASLDSTAQAIRRSQRAYPLEALARYGQALADLTFAESVFRKTGIRQSLAIVCFQLAQEYGRQGRTNLEREYLTEAADIAREVKDYPLLQKICTKLAASLRQSEPTLAYRYLDEASAIQDSISRSKSSNALELFNIEYETARREQTIAVQQLELSRQKRQKQTYSLIILLLAIAGALASVAIFRIRRSERRLKQSNEQKDFLFRVISHDIHSPAVAQLRGMQMLRSQGKNMPEEELNRVLVQLERQAESEVELIDNALRWARAKSGSVKPEPVLFVLDDLIKEVISQQAGSAQSKGISVNVTSPGNVVVCSVRSNLMLALRNLLSNAIKFSPRGETVRVVVEPHPDGAGLSIVDNGIGIPEDKIETIFDLGATFRRNGTDGEPSNGLGLTVSRDLLQEAGCTLGVQSKDGQGSCFTISIHNLQENV